jgi:hypothetical protein
MTQNIAQHIFTSKLIQNFFVEKSCPKITTSEIFRKILEESNHPKGENSPILVTLA